MDTDFLETKETAPLFLIEVEDGMVTNVTINEVYKGLFPDGITYSIMDNDEVGTPATYQTDGFSNF